MFQEFTAATSPDQGPPRLAALRQVLADEGLAGFMVPRADAHQGEYVAPRDDRLAWLTGFTGSAGFAIVLRDVAGVFIDGRYRVQVKAQVETSVYTPVHWPEVQAGDWLKDQDASGTLAYDPWLHTRSEIERIEKALEGSGLCLEPYDNLVDRIWENQPAPPKGRISNYPAEMAGKTSTQKRSDIAAVLTEAGELAAVLTLPDSIAWLLNIRGSDIPRVPIAHAFAILHITGRVSLFVDAAKLADLPPDPHVDVHPPEAFTDMLATIDGPVRADPKSAPIAVFHALGDRAVAGEDPCILPKACKTPVEIAGTRTAHLRDGAAMVEFLAWLDAEAPKGGLTEIAVAQRLEGFRRATNALRDISFDTISGAGPNGAIVHYRVTEDTNRAVKPGELLLLDSGGQYLDGTTDITRTIAVGDAPEDARAPFTRVLQGVIAISRARFPKGLAGRDLDALARAALWQAGQDYDHGTGHGVGTYLSVHEGPQRLSRISHVPLKPGMILSNEPGYYREGAFGIRLENLIVVREAPPVDGGDAHREMYDFETLTFVPIDRSLIVPEMLSADERTWLNGYHAEVRAKVQDAVSAQAKAWLIAATAPL